MPKNRKRKSSRIRKKPSISTPLKIIRFPNACQIEEMKTAINNLITKISELLKDSKRVNTMTMRWNLVLILLTIGIFVLGYLQLRVIKHYQDWSRNEMLRSPDLTLEINQIDTLVNEEVVVLHCSIYNRGNNIAKSVQILMPATHPDYPIELKVVGPNVMVISLEDGQENIKIPIYVYNDIIYYNDDINKPYNVKLSWLWRFHNIPSHVKNISWGYTLHYEKGSFDGYLHFDNPLYKN